jgi:quinol-cytochrome oxidoreductase complex cytochrome b subunit
MSKFDPEKGYTYRKGEIPFFPNHFISEVIVMYIILAVLVALAALFPAGLEEAANPFETPEHIKPEWYFLWVYQFLKVPPMIGIKGAVAELIGIFVPAIGVLLLVMIPFLDTKPERHPRRRLVAMAVTVLILLVIVVLSIWGMYS